MNFKKSITTDEILKEFKKKYNFQLFGQTIENFFRLYDVEFWKYIITYSNWIPMYVTLSTTFKIEIEYLIFENAGLIMNFHKEFYDNNPRSPKEISKNTSYSTKDVKKALKTYFQDYNYKHFKTARFFMADVSEIPDDIAIWNVTIQHIKKIITGNPPHLDKTLDEIYKENNFTDTSTIDNKIFEFKVDGFKDYKEYLIDQLNPVIDPEDARMWGLDFPGGILFYGPPGCGKTFWANEVARYLNYELREIPRSIFGSSYVDGAMSNLKKLLDEVKEVTKVILFFDEFDSIASERGNNGVATFENSKVVNTLLQEIPALIKKNILVVAASNFINKLDPAVIRPGRFDLTIPIFPPTPSERTSILLNRLVINIPSESPLLSILRYNCADKIEFWQKYTDQLDLLSTSFIIDISKNLKSKIRKFYTNYHEVKLTDDFIKESISLTRSKLTEKDVEYYANFYEEIKNVDFPTDLDERRKQLLRELEFYYRGKKNPPRPMGFRLPDVP